VIVNPLGWIGLMLWQAVVVAALLIALEILILLRRRAAAHAFNQTPSAIPQGSDSSKTRLNATTQPQDADRQGAWLGDGSPVSDDQQAPSSESQRNGAQPEASNQEGRRRSAAKSGILPDSGGSSVASSPRVDEQFIRFANSYATNPTNRRSLIDALRAEGIDAGVYTPYNTHESSYLVFTKYWFEPDDRAGTWLWASDENGSGYITVPFDFSGYERDSSLIFLGSLFDGVAGAEDAVRRRAIRITQAARLTPLDDRSYRVAARGAITTGATPQRNVPAAVERNRERSDSVDKRLMQFQQQMDDLRATVRGLESRMAQPAVPSSHRDNSISRRLDAIEERQTALTEQLSTLQADVRDLRGIRELVTSLQRALEERPQPAAGAESGRSVPLLAVAPPPSLSRQETPVRDSKTAAVPPPAPRLPSDWRDRLAKNTVEGSFSDGQTYALAVQVAYNELRKRARRGVDVARILHLLPDSTDDKIYTVHLNDHFEDEMGTIVKQCVDNVGALTPPQQFFIGFAAECTAPPVISVLCPLGMYNALFEFGALADGIPDSPYRVKSVIEPAQLKVKGDGRYEVVAPMKLEIERS
jgi:prefoldin subunit 5